MDPKLMQLQVRELLGREMLVLLEETMRNPVKTSELRAVVRVADVSAMLDSAAENIAQAYADRVVQS